MVVNSSANAVRSAGERKPISVCRVNVASLRRAFLARHLEAAGEAGRRFGTSEAFKDAAAQGRQDGCDLGGILQQGHRLFAYIDDGPGESAIPG